MVDSTPPAMTVQQAAERLSVHPDVVRAWIDAGLLRAVDAAQPGRTRRNWRIFHEALEEFLAMRQNRAPAQPKRRKPRAAAPVKSYF